MNIDLELEEALTPEQAAALADLVDEAEEIKRKHEEMRDNLAKVLVDRRDAAVKYRASNGIEQQWADDQAYYEGEDETGQSQWYKGLTMNAPLIQKPKSQYRSKVFLNITRPYVETAASKVVEVLCPVDDRAFSVQPSPVPLAMMEARLIDLNPLVLPPEQALPEQAQPQPIAPGAPLVNQAGAPTTPQELTAEQQRKADEALVWNAAKGAERWIDDALSETNYNRELRRCVDDAARLGTGIMRGPIPTVRISRKTNADGSIVMVEEIVPESKCVSVWNAYPDPACGDDIHRGQFFIERDMLVEKDVRALALDPSYIPEAIERVIEAGPKRSSSLASLLPPHESNSPDALRYDVWYYRGILSSEDVVAMGCSCGEVEGGVSAVITMIGDIPVKAHLEPMSDGKFPYDFMCWQRTAGSPWGIGIARQIRACQSILNANVRAMMENAGLSSGPQLILGRGSIIPADGKWEITPRKLWLLKPDADIPNVQQAFSSVVIPSIQQDLLQSVDFALKMAENVTGLPILLQGQQGPTGVPETVGGMQILVANASSLLRRMARIFDDSITKPHVTRYYQWMMDFGEDDSIKGDFQIMPRGSSALVIKDMRNTFMLQVMPQLIVNPGFGIDPTRYFKELAKINGLDPRDVQFTEAEMQALMSQPQQPTDRVQAAGIQAQARVEVANIEAQGNIARIERDSERDTAYIMAENERTKTTMATKMAELELRRELAMLEYANKHQLKLEDIKSKLAIEGGRMDLQRELSVMGKLDPEGFTPAAVGKTVRDTIPTPQVATPAVEPPGRASPGQGFVE
jgi:hypothetical protein